MRLRIVATGRPDPGQWRMLLRMPGNYEEADRCSAVPCRLGLDLLHCSVCSQQRLALPTVGLLQNSGDLLGRSPSRHIGYWQVRMAMTLSGTCVHRAASGVSNDRIGMKCDANGLLDGAWALGGLMAGEGSPGRR